MGQRPDGGVGCGVRGVGEEGLIGQTSARMRIVINAKEASERSEASPGEEAVRRRRLCPASLL